MKLEINFDMDGTIADLYAVENWLDDLRNERVRPYAEAEPMLNLSALARLIHKAQRMGYKVNIISWLSKTGSDTYNERVAEVKKEWLEKHLPSVEFDTISIVEYGTPKSKCGNGILFDDEEPNRNEWKGLALEPKDILDTLRNLA